MGNWGGYNGYEEIPANTIRSLLLFLLYDGTSTWRYAVVVIKTISDVQAVAHSHIGKTIYNRIPQCLVCSLPRIQYMCDKIPRKIAFLILLSFFYRVFYVNVRSKSSWAGT